MRLMYPGTIDVNIRMIEKQFDNAIEIPVNIIIDLNNPGV